MNTKEFFKYLHHVLDDRQRRKHNCNSFPGYNCIIDKNDYLVLRPKLTGKYIVSAWNQVVCALSHIHKKTIYLFPNYNNPNRFYRIRLNNKNFPGLISNSSILRCLIIPYIRWISADMPKYSWRLCVFTDKCQVFYNFPSCGGSFDGESKWSDIKHFLESEIWDLPGLKYPSKNKNCSETEYYNPLLPDQCYEYHPAVSDRNLKSKRFARDYGKYKKIKIDGREQLLSRFYFSHRNAKCNPFNFMGGYEPDYKMTLIGTYCSNTVAGARTIVFATSNGGADFYAKYEFDDYGQRGNYGSVLSIPNTSFSEISNRNLVIEKRIIVFEEDGSTSYSFLEQTKICKIYNSNTITIQTEKECNLESGNIVRIYAVETNGDANFLFDKNSFYKIRRIDDRLFELYELVSRANNTVPCRHIHGINRVKDGWMICTGEVFPEGWLYYVQMKEADTYDQINAENCLFKFTRLNQGDKSVQRLIGCLLFDDSNNSLMVASDSSTVCRNYFYGEISHNSTGIYLGRLNDVNVFSSFDVLYEMKEPCFFFKKLFDVIIAVGQRGEFAISFDNGKTWKSSRLETGVSRYLGFTPGFVVLDKYLLVIK